MFRFNINIFLILISLVITFSAKSQSIEGLKEVVSSQQEKIATIENTLKKLIGSIEAQSKSTSVNQNNKIIQSDFNSIKGAIKILENKIKNITNLSYDIDFSLKRIERHLELSSINHENKKQDKNEELKLNSNYKDKQKIKIDKKSLDGKTNGVLGFIKQSPNKVQPNKSSDQDSKNVIVLPKGSAEEQYNFAYDTALSGDYNKAEKALEEFLIRHKGHNKSADAQFMLGRVYYNQDKFEESAIALVEFNGKYPSDSRFQKSTLLIAEAVVNFASKKQACDIIKQSLEFMQDQTEKFKTRLNTLLNEKQCSVE